jgi:hypothetical protein
VAPIVGCHHQRRIGKTAHSNNLQLHKL